MGGRQWLPPRSRLTALPVGIVALVAVVVVIVGDFGDDDRDDRAVAPQETVAGDFDPVTLYQGSSPSVALAAVAKASPGDRWELTVQRDGEELRLPVTLGVRPG